MAKGRTAATANLTPAMPLAAREVEVHFRVDGPERLAQLLALLRRLGAAVGPPRVTDVRDVYVDTARGWLRQAGVACRLRTVGGATTMELKTLTPARAGLTERVEYVAQLPEVPAFPGPPPDVPLGRWLASLMPDPRLRVLFELHQHRVECHVTGHSGLRLAASADELTYGTGETFCEVELELKEGDAEALRHLAAALAAQDGFTLDDESKFTRGLRLAGAKGMSFEILPEWRLGADDRFVDSAYRLIRRQFAAMLWNEPGTRLGLAPEFLHAMRVAVRRLRSLVRIFRAALPPRRVAVLERNLRWLAGALGGVRDLDVYLTRVREMAPQFKGDFSTALAAYEQRTAEQRHRAREAMLRALASRRYARFVGQLAGFLENGPPQRPAAPLARQRVTTVAPRLIRKQIEKVLAGGRALMPDAPDEELHAQRIGCKRLRYLLEFFTDLYGTPAAKLAARARDLQDVLGAQHDAVVARQTITRFAQKAPPGKEARLWLHLMLGQMLAVEARREEEARAAYFDQWAAFDRKKTCRALFKRLTRSGPTA